MRLKPESYLDTEAMALESKLVLASRLCSAWMVPVDKHFGPFIAAGCWGSVPIGLYAEPKCDFWVYLFKQ